ncbi:hypothetical protein HYR82_05555 [Candidatus Peregrinibacteria bacterium]|nr:hypothetical protein [Candidatus Peregrinibacteria bacterium]
MGPSEAAVYRARSWCALSESIWFDALFGPEAASDFLAREASNRVFEVEGRVCLHALQHLGEDGIHQLMNIYRKNPHEQSGMAAFRVLANLRGEDASRTIPFFREVLEGKKATSDERRQALEALAVHLRAHESELLPLFFQSLEDPQQFGTALNALRDFIIETESAPALKGVIDCARRSPPPIRMHAARTIMLVARRAKGISDDILAALDDTFPDAPDERARGQDMSRERYLTKSLGLLGSSLNGTIDAESRIQQKILAKLRWLLRESPDDMTRMFAAQGLGRMSVEARDALAELENVIVAASSFSLARTIARALVDIAGLDCLRELLASHPDAFLLNYVAADVLVEVHTPEARLELEKLAKHSDREISEHADSCLVSFRDR